MLDLLSDILTRLKIQGTLYFRTSFNATWGVAVPAFENVARFHFAHRGDCRVAVEGEEEVVPLAQGDLIIIPHGAAHKLLARDTPLDQALPLDDVVTRSGYDGNGVLVYGSSDEAPETQLICGHFSIDSDAGHLIFDNLPPYIHIRNYGETSGKWMEASLRMIGDEAANERLGGNLIALRMSEVIFAQALRAYIAQEGGARPGLAGFADPQLARALNEFHKAPANDWTVEELARAAALSRTGFAQRFAEKMGITPLQYVTQWRMQIACNALKDDAMTVAETADLVGYASESAFTRVFKRIVGKPPASFRSTYARH